MKKQFLKLVLLFMSFAMIFSPLSAEAQGNVPQEKAY